MNSLDEIINESKDVREVKRALSVKMVEEGLPPARVSALLNVSLPYVSKWKGIYEAEGGGGLLLGYHGGTSYPGRQAAGGCSRVDQRTRNPECGGAPGLSGRQVWGGVPIQTVVLRFVGCRGYELSPQ